MFGKKKKDGVVAESASIAESASPAKTKGSKPKKQQSLKGGPNILVAHIEKAGLLATAGLTAFLAYSSFSTPGLQTSQEPAKLSSQAEQLLTQVKENHWEAIAPEREKFASTDGKFQKDVEVARKPVEESAFAKLKRLEPRTGPDVIEPRRDPTIFPVQDLVVKNISTTLAIAVAKPDDNVDPFESLDDAEPIKSKAAAGTRRQRENENQGQDMGQGMTGSSQMMRPKRRLRASYDLGAQFAILGAGMGMGMGEGGGMGMGPGAGMGPGMGDPGMGGSGMGSSGMGGSGMGGPGGMAGGAGGTGGTGGGLGEGPKGPTHRIGSVPVTFNAITALIPHRKIFEEYHKTFVNTGTFNPSRDLPAYLGLEVQRVEVTGNVYREIKEEEWKTILTNREIQDMPLDMFKQKNTKQPAYAWASHYPRERGKTRLGMPIPEVIDPRAVLKGLTAPIPPVLIRDYREFSKHPAIDWRWNVRFKRAPIRTDAGKKKESDDDEVVFGEKQGPAGGGMMGGTGGMMGGMGGGYGDEGGMMGGMGGGYGGYGDESGDAFGGGYGDGYGDMGGMGMGMGGMGMGMGGMGDMGGGMGMMGGGMATMLPENQPEFKMIRTYDFLPNRDLGKSYRYRMRVTMRDPNYPENQDYSPMTFKSATMQLPPPQNRELHHEVYDRISKLRASDDKLIEDSKAKNVYKARTMRYTDWSQPSPPVKFIRPSEAFVGDVIMAGDRIGAKMVVTQLSYSAKHPGAVLAAEVTAERGFVVGVEANKTKPLELISPTNKLVKKLDSQSVLPGQVVVDIRGGSKLAGDSKEDPLLSIGEIMLIRPDDSIIISNSLDDQFLYRMYSFQDDHEDSKRNPNGEMGMGGMGGSGMGDPGMGGAGMGEGGRGGSGS